MANRNNTQYFRLGIFVLLGIAALVGLVLVFGAQNLFSQNIIVETYVKESVQGLDVGAPVRFRGVRVGQVSSIVLSGSLYEKHLPFPERKQYVVVRMEIPKTSVEQGDDAVEKMVRDGMRAQVRSQGITGVNYIELDFVKDPSKLGVLAYDWKPAYPVIPSQPSPVNLLLDNLEEALKNVNKLDLAETQQKIDTLLVNLNNTVAGTDGKNSGLNQSVTELNRLLTRINKATDNEQLATMVEQLTASIVVLRQTLTTMQSDLTTSADNVRQITDNVNDLSQKANQHPSWLIFGQPPKKVAP